MLDIPGRIKLRDLPRITNLIEPGTEKPRETQLPLISSSHWTSFPYLTLPPRPTKKRFWILIQNLDLILMTAGCLEPFSHSYDFCLNPLQFFKVLLELLTPKMGTIFQCPIKREYNHLTPTPYSPVYTSTELINLFGYSVAQRANVQLIVHHDPKSFLKLLLSRIQFPSSKYG